MELVFSLNLAHKRLQTFSSCYFQVVDDLCYWESICVVPNGSGILNKNQFTSGAKQFIHPNLSLFQNLHVVSELGCLSCPSRCSCFVLGLNLFGSKWTWYLLIIQFTRGAKHFNLSDHLFQDAEGLCIVWNQFVWFPVDLVFYFENHFTQGAKQFHTMEFISLQSLYVI